MAQKILDYLAASQKLLQRLRNPEPCAKAQTKAVLAMLENAREKLDVPALASIQAAVVDAGFGEALEAELMEKLGEMCVGPQEAQTKDTRGKQDFTAFPQLLTATLWQEMELGAEESLFAFLANAGLRDPSEPTVQLIFLVLTAAHDGMDAVQGYSPGVRTAAYKQIKRRFQMFLKGRRPAPVHVAKLPELATRFKEMYPGIYEAIYADEPPVPCKLSKTLLATLCQPSATPMRNGRQILASRCEAERGMIVPSSSTGRGADQPVTRQELYDLMSMVMHKPQDQEGDPRIRIEPPREHFSRPRLSHMFSRPALPDYAPGAGADVVGANSGPPSSHALAPLQGAHRQGAAYPKDPRAEPGSKEEQSDESEAACKEAESESGAKRPRSGPEPVPAQMHTTLAETTQAILAATKAKKLAAEAKAKATKVAKDAAADEEASKAAAAAGPPTARKKQAAPAAKPETAEAAAAAPAAATSCKKRPAAAMGELPKLNAEIADALAKRLREAPPLKLAGDSTKSPGDRAYNTTWTRVRDFLLRKGVCEATAKSYARFHGSNARASVDA